MWITLSLAHGIKLVLAHGGCRGLDRDLDLAGDALCEGVVHVRRNFKLADLHNI
jgi:hypothetical protein